MSFFSDKFFKIRFFINFIFFVYKKYVGFFVTKKSYRYRRKKKLNLVFLNLLFRKLQKTRLNLLFLGLVGDHNRNLEILFRGNFLERFLKSNFLFFFNKRFNSCLQILRKLNTLKTISFQLIESLIKNRLDLVFKLHLFSILKKVFCYYLFSVSKKTKKLFRKSFFFSSVFGFNHFSTSIFFKNLYFYKFLTDRRFFINYIRFLPVCDKLLLLSSINLRYFLWRFNYRRVSEFFFKDTYLNFKSLRIRRRRRWRKFRI